MKRINSIKELRIEAACTEQHKYTVFFILRPGQPPLYKHITWYPDTNTYTIYHEIDDHYEEDLTEKQLLHQTHIAQAIEKKLLYRR